MSMIRLQFNQTETGRSVTADLPSDLSLFQVYEVARILLESKDVKHSFLDAGKKQNMGPISKERKLEAKTVLMLQDELILQLGRREIQIQMAEELENADIGQREDLASGIVAIKGNRKAKEQLNSDLQDYLSEQADHSADSQNPSAPELPPRKKVEESEEEHVVQLFNSTLTPKKLFEEPKVPFNSENLPSEMKLSYKLGGEVDDRGMISAPVEDRHRNVCEQMIRIGIENLWIRAVSSSETMLDFCLKLSPYRLEELCRFLCVPTRQNATPKSRASVYLGNLLKNPGYLPYVIKEEQYAFLQKLTENLDGKPFRMFPNPDTEPAFLMQFGILDLSFDHPGDNTLNVYVPKDIQLILDGMAGQDRAAVYANLEKADDTLRKWLSIYGFLPIKELLRLSGPGLDAFRDEKEMRVYCCFHGFCLNDIRTLRMQGKDENHATPYVATTQYDIAKIAHTPAKPRGPAYREFTEKERAQIFRGDLYGLSTQFDRLRRYLLLQQQKSNGNVTREAADNAIQNAFEVMMSGGNARDVMFEIQECFQTGTPVGTGILYLLVLDCMQYMPLAACHGYSRAECIMPPLLSGILDPTTEYEPDNDMTKAFMPFFMRSYMDQALLFTALDASGIIPVGETLKMISKLANGEKNPEFQVYCLYAYIAFNQYDRIPGQIELVRKMGVLDKGLVDWFVTEVNKRMAELPDSIKKAYAEATF